MPRRQTKYKTFDKWEEQGLIATRDIYDQFRRAGIPTKSHQLSEWVRMGFIKESPESAARRAKVSGASMYLTPREYKKAWYTAVLMHESFLTPRAASKIAELVLDLKPNGQGIIWIEAKNLLLGVRAIKGMV